MESDKSVLLVRSDVRLAGPGILMHAIAQALRDAGWRAEIATGGGALVERFEADGFVHHTVPGLAIGDRRPARMIAGTAALRRIAQRARVQVVHSFNAHAGMLAWLATRGTKAKVVDTVLGAGKERWLPWMPFPFIAVSDFVRRELVEAGVAPDRISVVHNSVLPEAQVFDESRFAAAWAAREPARPFRFVSVAMMHGDKGQRDVLEALAMIRREDRATPIRVEFVGDGSRRSLLEAFAADQGLDDIVSFAGAVTDVYPHIDRAHAMVHLSRYETFGMVLAEAQARGLPAIAYAIGGIPEVVEDGVSGTLVEGGDIAAVASAMAAFAADPARAMAMGRAGLDRCRAALTRPVLATNHEAVYRSL